DSKLWMLRRSKQPRFPPLSRLLPILPSLAWFLLEPSRQGYAYDESAQADRASETAPAALAARARGGGSGRVQRRMRAAAPAFPDPRCRQDRRRRDTERTMARAAVRRSRRRGRGRTPDPPRLRALIARAAGLSRPRPHSRGG